MSRNEIRLRRHRMTASGADRFRNYNEVLLRHEREVRIKKIIRAFLMFMLILILIGVMFFLWRIEQGDVPFEKKHPDQKTSFVTRSATSAPDLPSTP